LLVLVIVDALGESYWDQMKHNALSPLPEPIKAGLERIPAAIE
jgi:hypothetical protein